MSLVSLSHTQVNKKLCTKTQKERSLFGLRIPMTSVSAVRDVPVRRHTHRYFCTSPFLRRWLRQQNHSSVFYFKKDIINLENKRHSNEQHETSRTRYFNSCFIFSRSQVQILVNKYVVLNDGILWDRYLEEIHESGYGSQYSD